MVEQAEAYGLRLDPVRRHAILPKTSNAKHAAPDATAPIHESLSGWWWLIEYLLKRIKDPARGYARRWVLHRGQSRFVSAKANIHASVIERMQKVPDYRPPNLPPSAG